MNIIPVEFTVGFGGVEYGKTGLGRGDGDGDTDLYSECSHRIFFNGDRRVEVRLCHPNRT